MQFAITGFVDYYNIVCMIASDTLFDSRGGFRGQAIRWRHIAEIECLKVVAMATNFWTKIAIDWLYVNYSGYGGGLSGRPTECRYCQYPASKGDCHGNHFWLFIYGVHIGTTWRMRLNRPCAAAIRPYVNLLWPLVFIKHWPNIAEFGFTLADITRNSSEDEIATVNFFTTTSSTTFTQCAPGSYWIRWNNAK